MTAPTPAPIWFHPNPTTPTNPDAGQDFNNLWILPNTQWPIAASRISAIILGQYYVTHATTAQLQAIYAFATNYSFKVGMAWDGMFFPTASGAGTGFPGFNASQNPLVISSINAANGWLDFLEMDEPLFNGSWMPTNATTPTDPNPGPQWDIPTLITQLTPQVNQMVSAFPNVQIGDVEPFLGSNIPATVNVYNDTQSFIQQFKAAFGMPLHFLEQDQQHFVLSGVPFLNSIQNLANANGIPFAMEFDDGSSGATTDAEWAAAAQFNASFFAYNNKPPDIALITSFKDVPNFALPETDPTVLTNLINYYYNLYPLFQGGTLSAIVGQELTVTSTNQNATYQFIVDWSALPAGATAILRIYATCLSTGSNVLIWSTILGPVPPPPTGAIAVSPQIPSDINIAFSIEQLTGSPVSFPWKVRQF